MLVGWEMQPGTRDQITGGWPRIFSLSAPRTGRVSYLFNFQLVPNIAGVIAAWRGWDAKLRQFILETYRVYVADFSAGRCSYSEPRTGIAWLSSDNVAMLLLPLDWSDWPGTPQPLVSRTATARAFSTTEMGGVFGMAPVMAVTPPPASLAAKPGSSIELPAQITLPQAGATVRASYQGATRDIALNMGEGASLGGQERVPAFLPGGSLTREFAFEIKYCNFRDFVRSDQAYREVLTELEKVAPATSRSTTIIRPTDAVLVDTSRGTVQILGNDLTYRGGVVAGGQTGPVEGSAPQWLEYRDLKFLRLEFSRGIALCEDGGLLSESSSQYEYSVFPTPLSLGLRASALATALRPENPGMGPPVPRVLSKPRIRMR